MHKSFFGLENDLYIVNCYIPPCTSEVHKGVNSDYFEILTQEIAKYSALGEIMICGDLNSRVGEMQESWDDFDQDVQFITRNAFPDTKWSSDLPIRYSEDKTINSFGRSLMHLINKSHLIMLNGRSIGDSMGKKTCFKYNGSSAVDYCIVSGNLLNNVC